MTAGEGNIDDAGSNDDGGGCGGNAVDVDDVGNVDGNDNDDGCRLSMTVVR